MTARLAFTVVAFGVVPVVIFLLCLGRERNDPDSGRDFPRGRPTSGGG